MILRTESIAERLARTLKSDLFAAHEKGFVEVTIRETKSEGAADVRLRVAGARSVVEWSKLENRLNELQNAKTADGAIWIEREEGVVEAHIIE